MEGRSRNHCNCGKAICIMYCGCMSVALFIQHEVRMRLVILSSVASPAVSYFLQYLINGTIFWKKLLNIKMGVLILRETFLILRRNVRDSIMYIGLRVKCPLFLSDFNEN
jgi:hypothetical protein